MRVILFKKVRANPETAAVKRGVSCYYPSANGRLRNKTTFCCKPSVKDWEGCNAVVWMVFETWPVRWH